ncbi:Crp/Fnr family transcriptional regulator [Anaerosacchariphilus polymeriproducens]|uniref:Crp/Fnr family transcriptional regulator n=1 Tax=Anaerosacchariphilus polymeriproducens TaxID=1812858 RepID=A0A371ARP5_9FIRM|nr:Crp/Fnr family transcriptional regulator [Anaerosacchariphilus polymeriproducens]RDU22249.1 Crp/Fnr family transcriptional regulator [Anaerosacchariphilus polymeriproducens]
MIKNIPFFKDIDESIINKIKFTIKKYSKNETIYNQGDKCINMDIVISGNLVAYSLSQNGSENVVFNFNKGSIIGANLLFGTANHYPMNIYCTENCELLHVSKSQIEILLKDYNFTINFIKSISQNSQGMNRKIVMYTQKSLRENIMDYFLALSLEQKSKTITLPISKKQLADYFGVQRPSLFRELKKMKDNGEIEVHNKKIVINEENDII